MFDRAGDIELLALFSETICEREQLGELREICLRLLASSDDEELAEELLAPESGFFFGGFSIDEWYWQDLKDTVKQIDRVLAMPDNWSFSYQSSW